ncbi:Zinc knuckle [Popillia japonica]|uniref:Zinc knuckle n=1 Tax=Popillia japonica TaxID=7064 RepID=A0AAW1J1S7_POPJA
MEEMFSQLKDAGSELLEEEKINYVLLSMPKSYENVITALETMDGLKLDFTKNRLLGEEEKKKKLQVMETPESSFLCYTCGEEEKKKKLQVMETPESSFLCYTCGKPGHKQYQCKNVNYRQEYGGERQSQGRDYNQRGNSRGRGNNRGRSSSRGRGYSQGRNYGNGHGSYSRGRGQTPRSFVANRSASGDIEQDDEAFLCGDVYKCEVADSNIEWYMDSDLLKLRSDNGREYVSREFQQFCDEKGIQLQYTVAYNPELNGVAERMNRTLIDKARTILLESDMPKHFWGEAVYYSAYVTNRSPTAFRRLEKNPE